MTDSQFLTWLTNPQSIGMVLVEVSVQVAGAEVTRYLSTKGYNTSPTEFPANQHYMPIVSTGLQFTETLSLNGQASLQAGDIELENYNGIRDSWLNDIWVNRAVSVYVGDPKWVRSDFRMIFNGIISDIANKDRNTLALKLRDKLQRLNTPVSELTLSGTTPNKDQLIPISMGEVHNVTPLLTDPVTLEYQLHDRVMESINEVRDNGVPVTVTTTPLTGKFKLSQQPAGTITVSAQGHKPSGTYSPTLATIVSQLVTDYGNTVDRFTIADLDTANIASFNAAHPQPLGTYLNGRTNVLNAVQSVAVSLGAQIVMSRLGLMQLYQLTFPASGTITEVRPKNMVQKTLVATGRTNVIASVQLGFNKNWTVQQGLQTAIPAQHKSLFETEWLTSISSNAATKTTYKLNTAPVQQDTMLLRRVDADTEAARQLAMWSVPRTTYEFEGLPEMLLLTLGQPILVFNSRYGMTNGVAGVVISLQPDWISRHVKVGFII